MPRKTTKRSPRSIRTSVKHAVVPHRNNSYHPHLIRWKGIVLVLVVVAGLLAFPQSAQRTSVLGESTDVTSQYLLDDTNEQRARADVEPLAINHQLSVAATNKARDMFTHQYWAHVSPEGTAPWYWFKDAQYTYSFAGENLAKGFHTSGALISAWMHSPEHRDNMLNPNYEDVGFAVIDGTLNGESTKLVVAMYGKQSEGALAGTAATVLAARGSTSLMTRLGVGLQTMTPTLLASVALLLLVGVIALVAHTYRRSLPKPMLKSWKRHHGLYKAVGMVSLVLVLIVMYGEGQIL